MLIWATSWWSNAVEVFIKGRIVNEPASSSENQPASKQGTRRNKNPSKYGAIKAGEKSPDDEYSDSRVRRKLDPEEFIDWMYTIERIFDYEEVPEKRKVKLAARAMTKRFLPEHFRRDLFLKLQSLQQTSNVPEYTREFERLMFQCDVQEASEQTIAGSFEDLSIILQIQSNFNSIGRSTMFGH
ncbi:hypothetical protein MLD38_038083 [Melastoma candidum]|uniref:Uncharacterized protein n=1 Tax=Melastoma candidum TaxID=119954 RepID=A0ACB9KYY1_9MYRT|nr:hypothetical protein MLD38_038083 [Melastoma candidum]